MNFQRFESSVFIESVYKSLTVMKIICFDSLILFNYLYSLIFTKTLSPKERTLFILIIDEILCF